MNIEKVNFGGWENCYRLSNGRIELIVTTDVGPRIMKFGFVGGTNILKNYEALLGSSGADSWVNYGGHRLWHAPEDQERTYQPDNTAVQFEQHPNCVRLTMEPEANTGIQKEIDIALDSENAEVMITHRLINRNLWDVEAAPWALSVMREGGEGFLLHPPRRSHEDVLTPQSALIMWAYTDLGDGRFSFTPRTTRLRQNADATTPQKIGIHTSQGWCGYHWQNLLLLKQITPQANANYPDMGSRMELFTDSTMLEVETLGPLTRIGAGTAVEHQERWVLLDVPATSLDDKELLDLINGVS